MPVRMGRIACQRKQDTINPGEYFGRCKCFVILFLQFHRDTRDCASRHISKYGKDIWNYDTEQNSFQEVDF